MTRNSKGIFGYAAWLSGASLILVATSANAQLRTIRPGDEVSFSNIQIAGDTTGGGQWVAESETLWARGIITAIEVCAGDAVNSIAVYYKGKRGTSFGGPGGNCETWQVPPGEFIQSVEVWSGAWMNKIIFKTNKYTTKAFGGPGGNRRVWEDPDGGSLRRIDGKYGIYMNGIKLHYSRPYRLGELVYDSSQQRVKSLPPKRIVTSGVNACNYANEQPKVIEVRNTVRETHTLSFGVSAGAGLETTLSAGIPDLAQVSVKSNYNVEIRRVEDTTKENILDFSESVPILAKPGQWVNVETVTKTADLTVPFTYELLFYNAGDPDVIVDRKKFTGTYTGTQVLSSDTTPVIIPCPPGSGGGSPQPVPAPASNPAIAINQLNRSNNLSGAWSCPPYGSINITQSGADITGNYSWGGVGTFQGDFSDRVMRVSVNDTNGKPIPYEWELKLSQDGNRLEGRVIENKSISSQWACSRTGT